jgi:hypothetical protein
MAQSEHFHSKRNEWRHRMEGWGISIDGKLLTGTTSLCLHEYEIKPQDLSKRRRGGKL